MLSIVFCGAETLILRKIDQKGLKNSEVWRWRREEMIIFLLTQFEHDASEGHQRFTL
jgi:hypothetical protein